MAVGHGEQLPFREAALDVIVCLEVLEHVEHPHKLLSENEAMLEDGWLRLGHSAYGDPAIQASVVLVDSIRQRESLAPRPRPEVSR
jgi:ubiquinone/menaquinone biosynthesis C-methylase UbiE